MYYSLIRAFSIWIWKCPLWCKCLLKYGYIFFSQLNKHANSDIPIGISTICHITSVCVCVWLMPTHFQQVKMSIRVFPLCFADIPYVLPVVHQPPVGNKFGSVRRGKVWPVSPDCRYMFIPAALQTAYSLTQATQGLQYTTYNTSLRQQHKSERPRRVQCTGNSYGCWVTVRRYALVLQSNTTVELDGGLIYILGNWV